MPNLVNDQQLGKLLDKMNTERDYVLYVVAVPTGMERFWYDCQPHLTKVVQLGEAEFNQGAWDL